MQLSQLCKLTSLRFKRGKISSLSRHLTFRPLPLRGLSFGHDLMRGRAIVEATAGHSSPRSYQPITTRLCARKALTPAPLLPHFLTALFFPSRGLDWTPNFSRLRLYTAPWVAPAVRRPARKCAPRRPPAH